jgi:hypothetical protein
MATRLARVKPSYAEGGHARVEIVKTTMETASWTPTTPTVGGLATTVSSGSETNTLVRRPIVTSTPTAELATISDVSS